MALLKAFVCQVVLLGLYKLFLEQVVEEHVVPDELTRNCLVGVVCLLCFGIQLYTDKAEDDKAEDEKDPKAKSKSRESAGAKKFESAEISVTPESHVTFTKSQTTSQEMTEAKKQPSKNQQIVGSKEESSAVASTEAEKVSKIPPSGVFAEFSTNVPDKIAVAASTIETSCEQLTNTIPVLNGLSDVNVFEESDEEGIEIDHFVPKEAEQLMTIEVEKVETNKPGNVTEAVMESECLKPNGVDISSAQDFDSDTRIDESESQITNGKVLESLNNIDEIPSSIIEENEGKISVKNGSEICIKQEITSREASNPDVCTKGFTESLLSAQEMNSTSTVSTKTVNETETENIAETSIEVNKTLMSPRRKIIAAEDLYVPHISIDISFIYACH